MVYTVKGTEMVVQQLHTDVLAQVTGSEREIHHLLYYILNL